MIGCARAGSLHLGTIGPLALPTSESAAAVAGDSERGGSVSRGVLAHERFTSVPELMKLITTSRPPGSSSSTHCGSTRLSSSSS